MALGRWKQRALSADFLDAAKSLSNKISRADGDERPSSGDSGISEERLYRKSLSSVQSKCEDSLQTCIKLEPLEADDVTAGVQIDEKPFEGVLSSTEPDKENSRLLLHPSYNDMGRSLKKTNSTRASRSKGIKQEVSSDNDSSTCQDSTDSSRQRRIVANARERSRIHTIGAAFNALRLAVPSNYDQQKLSKLAILRIASAYIRALASLIKEDRKEFTCGVQQCTQTLNSDGSRSKLPKSIS